MGAGAFRRAVMGLAVAGALGLGVLALPSANSAASTPVVEVSPSATQSGRIVVSAALPAAQAGRTLNLERQVGSKWVRVKTVRLPRNGWVEFNVPSKVSARWAAYRVVGLPYRGQPKVRSTAVDGSKIKRVFTDEFSGSQLGSAWQVRLPGQYFGLRKCSATAEQPPRVTGGKVLLQVNRTTTIKAECPNGVFSNAMIGTQDSFSAKYGTFAARIKFSPYQGQHGSFWLQGSREIDIAEFFGLGRRDSGYTRFVHWDNKKVGGIYSLKGVLPRGSNPANSYNVYSLDWTPTRYVFRVNGKVVLNTTRGLAPTAEYMILSNLTSDWENKLLPKDKLPTTTYVDWVRVWQSN